MIGTVALVAAGIVVLVAALALGYRAICQRRVARSLAINSPQGIAEDGYVRIGGVDQWLQIRGEDLGNPVLLFLHGSGMTMTPFTPVLRSWERHFTVVQWDRRGAGRTLARNGRPDDLTYAQMAADGIEVTEHLRKRLNVEKVILVGHSQGTIVGILMARQRPDLFTAYVGTGQITDMARNETETYELAIERAQASGAAKAVRALAGVGAPPLPSAQAWLVKQRWSFMTDPELRAWGKKSTPMVLTAPNRSLRDVYLFNQAFTFFPQPLYEETITWDSAQHGTRFDLPFFLFHGAVDNHTLTSLATEYFGCVEAPVKKLVLIPGGGHCAVLAQPELFLTYLLANVIPLTEPAEGGRRS